MQTTLAQQLAHLCIEVRQKMQYLHHMVSDAFMTQSPARYPPVKVGLVGAGQWAATMHAPLHSAGAETELAGVWSASGSTAESLAAEYGVRAFGTFGELLASCEAVGLCRSASGTGRTGTTRRRRWPGPPARETAGRLLAAGSSRGGRRAPQQGGKRRRPYQALPPAAYRWQRSAIRRTAC